jgi:protein-tyrosine phosphatase
MIDLHSHILPGLDDGAPNIMASIGMAKIAVDCGIRGMAVTPHCCADRRKDIREAILLLRDVLQESNIPLILYPGMEIKGTPNTADMLAEGQLITINGSRYPLIEFDFKSSGEMETNILRDVVQAGFVPIVAHPERYSYVQEEPELLNLWKTIGCGFQVNRGSFIGHFGEAAKQLAYEMTARGFTTVVSSDAHSDQHRIPWLKDVKMILARHFDPIASQYLLRYNPLRILRNEELLQSDPDWF